ncbi:MAG: ATP-binding protein [Candidatus Gracilibacteria bacterium]|jgi:hypothetical protein
MPKTIYERSVMKNILPYLSTDEVVVLHGARQVGKTSIMKYVEKNLNEKGEITYFIDLEDRRFKLLLDEGVDPFIKHLTGEGLFERRESENKSKIFVFIDEIQYLEDPSSFLKLTADHHKEIKLIVSGSSSFDIKNKFKDSLTGRTINFEIFPLSFEEFLIFKEYYFDNKSTSSIKTNELKLLYEEFTLYGGYPKIVLTGEIAMKQSYLNQIIDTYIKKDIRDLANIKNIDKFNRLLEILASQSGQLLNVTELADTAKLARQTTEEYLLLLENTYIIRLVRPYSGNMRKELFKTPKIFFYDTGLMQMLWLKELPKEILGQTFETSIFGELVKKEGLENVYFWRTTDKKEIDFITKKGKSLLPIEVKLNFAQSQTLVLKSFLKKYNSTGYKIISIKGEKTHPFQSYPWEI